MIYSTPSHFLRVDVPLNLADDLANVHPDLIQEALGVILSACRIAVAGILCGDVTVSLTEHIGPQVPTPMAPDIPTFRRRL